MSEPVIIEHRSVGAQMLHQPGYWVHRQPDGAYRISPFPVETFQMLEYPMQPPCDVEAACD